eukprot:6493462-Prymnesium_polylepis.1
MAHQSSPNSSSQARTNLCARGPGNDQGVRGGGRGFCGTWRAHMASRSMSCMAACLANSSLICWKSNPSS